MVQNFIMTKYVRCQILWRCGMALINPIMTGPIIDTMYPMSVRFLYARTALGAGAFQAFAGDPALPDGRRAGCFMPERSRPGVRPEMLFAWLFMIDCARKLVEKTMDKEFLI